MFETSESVRVSMLPKQHQCLADDVCSDSFGPQNPCVDAAAKEKVFLELETTIDVPFDANNEYTATGVRDVSATVTNSAADTGCHWGAGSIWYNKGSNNDIVVSSITKSEKVNGVEKSITYIRTLFSLRTPCMSAKDSSGNIVNDVFSTCAAGKDGKDYDFDVQLVSCYTVDDLQECARGNTTTCDNRCVKTGNRQVPTTVQAEVTFIEQLPDVDLTETTAIQLTAKTFKYGSPTPVDYAAAGQSFVAKDTLVFAVAPASTTAFEDPAFALTCPEKYLAAYNPVSAECTTDKAREWTYKSRTDSDVDLLDETCAEDGSPCAECAFDGNSIRGDLKSGFPRGLIGQSVLFDRATKVVICNSDGTAKRVLDVRMLDFVHSVWTIFYEEDARAKADNCNTFGTCQRPCTGSLTQIEQGCGRCKQSGSFGNGKFVLPILSATPIVLQGAVPTISSTIIDSGHRNVEVCKHAGADASNPSSYGNPVGFNENNVCNSTLAKTPRHCGFPGLDQNNEFNENAYISAGASVFCGALLANTLYSISAHWYVHFSYLFYAI